MMDGAQYVESLRRRKPRVFYKGKRLERPYDHPAIAPHVKTASVTYQLARDPRHAELMTATSHLTGEKVSRFTHLFWSVEDLVKKIEMLRLIGQETGTCFQRCVGLDGINALWSVTFEMDKKNGSDYHARFRKFLERLQRDDLMSAGAMTDPKGDRSLPPWKQPDPDVYVHIVERRADGIVIRGAKTHITGSVNSHEILVLPTLGLPPEGADYAVACAVPIDAPGLTVVFGRQTNDERKEEEGIDCGTSFGIVGGESTLIFEDVFVPTERVFMAGEGDFAGLLVDRFAAWHRANYGGCKAGNADVLVGATALLSEIHGTIGNAVVKDKLTEMIHLVETNFAGAVGSSALAKKLPAGNWLVDPLLANAVKQNITRFVYQIARLAHDLGGGILSTMPSDADFGSSEIGGLLRKYFVGRAGFATDDKRKLVRYIEGMTSVSTLVEALHGAGSPQAQRIVMLRQGNLPEKARLAKKVLGIGES
ncbi:MAG TPA: 4-hydroxyphenylacetate 3-hydroxylase N-terminal domain-containing protein [Anaeromyxobacteraceae bacterium]|nr:4-hydroxyphenylacetate 3-hydroxylase N-terminal domain-containing protein [Anaeromyxobacteraceae bacterium]